MESNNNNKAMSREEQLQQTAEEWADYYKHAEDLCDYISIRVAFKEGAKWADEHPANVWHQASEMPKEEEWILIQFVEDSYYRQCKGVFSKENRHIKEIPRCLSLVLPQLFLQVIC